VKSSKNKKRDDGSADAKPYEVGYSKPPTATRFQPGVSGNPVGRKKGSKNKPPGMHEERLQEIFLLRVPSALPYFFTGLRIAATLAPIGAIVGDAYAGNSAGGQGGLGFLTIIYSAQFQLPALFATAAVGCLLGFVFAGTVVALSWFALHHWHDSYQRKDL